MATKHDYKQLDAYIESKKLVKMVYVLLRKFLLYNPETITWTITHPENNQ